MNRELFESLLPLCRSITGNGVRETLALIAAEIPLNVVEIPSGEPMLDWTTPQEWNIRDAFVADATGNRLIDFAQSPLHVVSYSEPVRRTMTFDELRLHLHTLPDRPDWIPYRTSYWNQTWGFCLRHNDLVALEQASQPFQVVIDSEFSDGSLTYGEILVRGTGASNEEIVVTTHICHPAMANDNVSGMVALTAIAKQLLKHPVKLSVRCLFLPGTVGSLAWLDRNQSTLDNVKAGLVLTGLGDQNPLTYKASRGGKSRIDRVAQRTLLRRDPETRLLPWDPYGYDERQFCSPGFDLPFGRLTRGVHGQYPEYHTSSDNAEFVSGDQLDAAVEAVLDIISTFSNDIVPVNLVSLGEPQLGRRGLYSPLGGAINTKSVEMGYLWILSLADGNHSVDDIAAQSGLETSDVLAALDRLIASGLVSTT